MTPFEYFDASGTGGPTRHASSSSMLGDLTRTGTEAGLNRALDDINALVAEMSAKDRAEQLPPELVSLLDEITGADDAPLAWASLHRRVHSQRTPWEAFWRDPTVEEDGLRLVSEVMRRARAGLQEGLVAAREAQAGRPEA